MSTADRESVQIWCLTDHHLPQLRHLIRQVINPLFHPAIPIAILSLSLRSRQHSPRNQNDSKTEPS